jgi:ketol-acid reductoisomerase
MDRWIAPSDENLIEGRAVAVIGYGNQGRPHALNLRDSGAKVVVGVRDGGPSATRARADGLAVKDIGDAAAEAEFVMVATPDESMAELFTARIAPRLSAGQILLFAHGFNVHFGFISPPNFVDVGLVSPKGAGVWVRRSFEEGGGLPAMVAVHQDATGWAWERVQAYASGIGSARAGLLKTTFREETECDLFGEQAVLCGGIPAIIRAGYQTLVEAGYSPEAAWFETVYEAKLIVDLLLAKGERGMAEAISNTAEFGGELAADLLVDDATRERIRGILERIQSGEFAKQWMSEASTWHPSRSATTDAVRIEVLGRVPSLRARLGAEARSNQP